MLTLHITTQAWLVARLLRSPSFHRMVARMHSRLTGKGHVEDYSELGGTKLQGKEEHGFKKFIDIYIDEFKNNFKR
ncbi:hypothetical protein L873DRAFT_1684600 [Choiromyces venosus 120613-1]|uniref:Uncharacterized protein n=1 Tax=Choiromyces venosus 120613-1 TaxID=1336337 RepID=A0A3N4JSU4_9PEZI|nr:hypothetical protein L873DRAFT_1684600 [Choiromyces venosus 120613-1]